MQHVWCHADEASWSIGTAPFNSMCRVVARSWAFTQCWHGQTHSPLLQMGLLTWAQFFPVPSSAWWLPDRNWLVACGKGMAAQLPVSDCAGVLSSACRLKTGTALSRSCCTENSAPHCSQMLTAYGAGAAATNPLTGNCGIICIYRKLVPEVLPAMVYTIKCMKIYILDCFSCLMQQLSSMSRSTLVSSPVTESLLGALIRIESISL